MKLKNSLALLPLFAFGCVSANVNPSAPRANTGYADFYSEMDAELCWDVRDAGTAGRNFKTMFSDVKPVEKDVLRLAFAPGHHHVRVTFLNRVIANPAETDIEIKNGKVTPVRVTLTEAGTTFVQSKEISRGNTFYGRAGRRTKINSDETVRYDLSAAAEASVSYRPRDEMPYAR
jgi:hypothetical protein